jgi:bifunctional DNA-binding transcriptional regulator/antitoxin component of YhaV-PrlF toxin-antitoxin module
MVELKTKMTRSGMVYIPKEVRDSFGAALRIIPDARAAVVFPEGARYQDVLDSLEIIASDIRHRIRLAQGRTGDE